MENTFKHGWILLLFSFSFVYSQQSSRLNMEMYQNLIVHQHNEFRRLQMSSDMKELVWGNDLARDAMNWARKCHFAHSNGRNGENLYFMESPMLTERQFLQRALDSWFAEGLFWRSSINCGKSCAYTQMVWALTSTVGCAVRKCRSLTHSTPEDATKNAWFLVCHYNPKGNDDMTLPFQSGPACTQCDPWEFCRNSLCAEERIPTSPPRSFRNFGTTLPPSGGKRNRETHHSSPELQNAVMGVLKEIMSFSGNKTNENNKLSLTANSLKNWNENRGNTWEKRNGRQMVDSFQPYNKTGTSKLPKPARKFSWKSDTQTGKFKFRILKPLPTPRPRHTTVYPTTVRTVNVDGEPIEIASSEISTSTTSRPTTVSTYSLPQRTDHGCVDSDVNCRHWKVYCEDNVFVFENCRLTCNSCHIPLPPQMPSQANIVQPRIKAVPKSTQEMIHRKHHHHHDHHINHHDNKQNNSTSPELTHHHRPQGAGSAQNDRYHGNNMVSVHPNTDSHHNNGHNMASLHPSGNLRQRGANNKAFVQPNAEKQHHHGNKIPDVQGMHQNSLYDNFTSAHSSYGTTTDSGAWKLLDTSSLHVNEIELMNSIRDPPNQAQSQIQHFHVDTSHNMQTPQTTPSFIEGTSFNGQSATFANDPTLHGTHQNTATTDFPTFTGVCEDFDPRCTLWSYLCGTDWSVKTVCPKTCQLCHV